MALLSEGPGSSARKRHRHPTEDVSISIDTGAMVEFDAAGGNLNGEFRGLPILRYAGDDTSLPEDGARRPSFVNRVTAESRSREPAT